jgi:hypothetical protein
MVPVAVLVDGDNLSGKHAARIREIAGHLGSPTVLRNGALTDRHQAPHPDIEAQLQGIVRSTSTVARSRASEGPSEPPRSRPSEFCAGPDEARPAMSALVRRFGGLPGWHQRNRLWHGAK